MSKKTRKKSSKPSPKSRKTPARKPSVAKTAGRRAAASVKKPAAKVAKTAATTATKAAVGKPDKTAKSASVKASHKPPSKQLKSNLSVPPKPATGTGLVEGAMAPGFSLPRDGGGSVSLADYAAKKLVLFFYPRADTPGCTREAIDFTRLSSAFAEEGAAVLGISADTVKAQESFRSKHQLSVPLISDEQHEMLEAYGAWGEKSMYGRSFMGIIRTTVLIGADGRIAKIWRNVRVDGHADEVLAAVRAM
ncbi:redoxin domain-containing protein [Bradyrhizobium sp. CSA112]|uniref:peroxiredoxin n=1 Tax=Bradyrhizobium sp. CSA112 TaxID=2699170 RepID=UPI0023B00084|nr:peroxiredoxin [Bradyrhizobium sp. CSA112]MDE5454547.1 redoxin domain-containing protein [Bradyrhizobium sp. CSA112]